MRIDKSVTLSTSDKKTTDENSNPLVDFIAGVKVAHPIVHNDHRGRVFEIFSNSTHMQDFWVDPVVYCYAFTVRRNQTKGWGLHEEKTDRYTLVSGELLTILYDARTESSTYGKIQKVYLGDQGNRMLLIPAGVWHMNINISDNETFLINHPTTVYDHDKPDRKLLKWDSDLIPVDLKEFFPIS